MQADGKMPQRMAVSFFSRLQKGHFMFEGYSDFDDGARIILYGLDPYKEFLNWLTN